VIRPLRLLASASILLLLLAACGGGDGGDGGGPVGVEIHVEGGHVSGPERVEVTQGETVRLQVTADVSDEVHVHGYDVHAEVTPDEPAEIELTADVAGIFEVELEEAGTLLTELEVAP
jgi:hypothetical protein